MFEYIEGSLRDAADEKYREFTVKLVPNTSNEILGVRMPVLRKMARQILTEDWRLFLAEYKSSRIYEIITLRAVVIASAKCSFDEKRSLLKEFLHEVDNWAVCDTLCSTLKPPKSHIEPLYGFTMPYMASENEFEVRFAAVTAIYYFLTDGYIDSVLKAYQNTRHEGYYAKMAVAWGLSYAYLKYKHKTLAILKSGKLDKFTHNKAIQKMLESFRVSDEDKAMLKGMRK